MTQDEAHRLEKIYRILPIFDHHSRNATASTFDAILLLLIEDQTMAHAKEEYDLFSSLRYDPQIGSTVDRGVLQSEGQLPTSKNFYMLGFHRDRILSAAKHFGWEAAVEAISGVEGLRELERALAAALSSHKDGHSSALKVCGFYSILLRYVQVRSSPVTANQISRSRSEPSSPRQESSQSNSRPRLQSHSQIYILPPFPSPPHNRQLLTTTIQNSYPHPAQEAS
jgi:hypothetical protein